MAQEQLRLPQKTIEDIDKWVAEGGFKSRSDAIKSIINYYQERVSSNEVKRQNNTQNRLSL